MLDLREIDLKLGPILKWDKEKLEKLIEEIKPSHEIVSRVGRKSSGGRYPRAAKYLEETGRRYNTNTQNERLKQLTQKLAQEEIKNQLQYVIEERFGQPPEPAFVSPALGYPHPTNYDLEHFPCPLDELQDMEDYEFEKIIN